MKRRLFSLLVNLALVAVPLLVLEAAFRLLPVAYLPQLLPVNERTPLARWEPNVEYRYSRDWDFSVVTRKRSNNYGFIHAADYRAEERSPLMAVIGDSLVEGNHVDAGKSVAELLHASVAGTGRVYSFGISGAPLSQYLAYAQFARRVFRADALAFVVAPNDFDESLLKYKSDRRFHYFTDDGRLERVDYELSTTRKILRQSAMLRYAMQNLDAGLRLEALLQSLRGGGLAFAYSGEALERRLADSQRAITLFLDALGDTGLDTQSIVFIVDPLRPAVYTAETWAAVEDGYYARMTRAFIEQAAARGYEVIDLAPVFIARYRADGTKFEVAPTDSHWSALGHAVAAAEVRKSRVFAHTFSPASHPVHAVRPQAQVAQ